MASLRAAFTPGRTSALDARFTVRSTASGGTIIVPKTDPPTGDAAIEGSHASAAAGAAVGVFHAAVAAAASASSATGAPAASGAPAAATKVYRASSLDLDARVALCRSVAEEAVTDDDLVALLKVKSHPVCYDGFEPSGRMHVAQGLYKAMLVNKLTRAGCVFKFWVADWFALLNNKMDGDLKKIRKVGEYMIEVWKAAGMDMTNVEFLWASDEINARANEYWLRVMDIARSFNVPRVTRCCTIMGRKETDDLTAAQIFYPCMQCADIFFLKADICQLGMDQRKVNMLAREYCDAAKPKIKHKPVILSHHMLMGLSEGQEKMSKSDPDSAIFMEDTVEDVKRKIKRAYCPPGIVEANPCLDWCKYIVFGNDGFTWSIPRSKEGDTLVYASYAELEADYVSGKLHPSDLKPALTLRMNELLEPIRLHFASGEAKKLLETVRGYRVSR